MTAPTAASSPTYAAGSLVHARGRDWVVLPDSDAGLLVLRPLGGGDDDVAAVLPALEEVVPASFAPPTPGDLGDDRSARLLRDALRIGFRSTGGPFRCLASLAVTPRPYQLVPLLLALRQDTVRLLIADDVGIGKTVEAGLVAAELLAQGSARGLSVLCPPSLAPQWQTELTDKFGLQAELVLPGTVRRLERSLSYGESIFERHTVTVVSTDFIKSDRRRDEFLRSAPDLVIVDEAHSSVNDDTGAGGSGRTQRYRLVRDLAGDTRRHLILVTATPHSGNEGAFRNLIALLDEGLKDTDLDSEAGRRRLADHMVQRRRADIRSYLQQDTKFPSDRQVLELAYTLSPGHRALFDDVLIYVRGQVQDRSGTRVQQRVRWWSALSLLRSTASSPAAAAATLATRAAAAQADDVTAADRLGSAEVLDLAEDDALDAADATPGAVTVDETGSRERRVLRQMAERAQQLAEDRTDDAKLGVLVRHVRALLDDGFHPIVFCRFIPTAHYVTEALRAKLGKVEVEVVTGELAAEERAVRIADLSTRAGQRPKVLVATDCLSEGVNLQEDFQAVVHYDLAWNPTRHEQREGRVDRFGQPSDVVRATLIYGEDNGIDGIVLDVLLRKHEAIRKVLGISVPVPPQSDQVLAALLEGVLLRGGQGELQLDFGDRSTARALEEEWRSTAEAERVSRSRYAQASIHPDEVQAALEASRAALGEPDDVASFVATALQELGVTLTGRDDSGFTADLGELPVGLRDTIPGPDGARRFAADLPAPKGAAVLQRTDPAVGAIARFVLDSALDDALPAGDRPARRCGLVVSADIRAATVMLLLRVRTHVTLPGRDETTTHVAEEARVVAFIGPPSDPQWLTHEGVERLLTARPGANVPPDVATGVLSGVIAALPALQPALDQVGRDVADGLRDAHVTVRQAARGERAGGLGVRGLQIEPQLPVDVLGVYVYRPMGGGR